MATSGVSQGGFVQSTSKSSDVTDRGTKIVQEGQNDDENTFVKILVAEMANQDPTSQNQDPTQYISQLAQFSALEQMTNLNATMKLNGAASLVGKAVEFNALDDNGKNYVGVVQGVSKNGDDITLAVVTNDNGTAKIHNFDYSQIMNVADVTTSTDLNTTMKLNGAASLIGKTVKFNVLDSSGKNYEGVVQGVSRNGNDISLSVVTNNSGTSKTQDFDYSEVVNIENVPASTTKS